MSSNNIYCVYLTIYKGNKLPPFYIGSTAVDNIHRGYRGSVGSREYKILWKNEIKLNPHLFVTKILSYHQTRNEAVKRENQLHHALDVVNNPLYVNKWYATVNGFKGYNSSGINNPMYGKKRPDAAERMRTNNPIHNKESQKKILDAKARKYAEGSHKSTANKPQTIEKTKARMLLNNPAKIKCSCIECGKEIPITFLNRHMQLSHSPFDACTPACV